jgi:hypothetical protein
MPSWTVAFYCAFIFIDAHIEFVALKLRNLGFWEISFRSSLLLHHVTRCDSVLIPDYLCPCLPTLTVCGQSGVIRLCVMYCMCMVFVCAYYIQ